MGTDTNLRFVCSYCLRPTNEPHAPGCLLARLAALEAERDELNATMEAVREAAVWVLHVANGVGKAGGQPSENEYIDSMDALKAALNDSPKRSLDGHKDGHKEGSDK